MDVLVVGGGLFGVTGALELARRGHKVTLLERSPVPNEEAASQDISKMVRLDYGDQEAYTRMMEVCEPALLAWNKSLGGSFYHRTGILNVSTRASLEPGTFSGDSLRLLRERGHEVHQLEQRHIEERFGAWKGSGRVGGYYNPKGGWVESGKLLAALARQAVAAGVSVVVDQAHSVVYDESGAACGVRSVSGRLYVAQRVVVAAGAWTPTLVPRTRNFLRVTAQPVVHFELPERVRAPFLSGPSFPAWSADTEFTGFYGFPSKPDGRLKVGHHSDGYALEFPTSRAIAELRERVKDKEVERFRAFARRAWPSLPVDELRVSGFRICLYCDSADGDFLISEDPEHPNLFVSSGGSGHGAKFAPLLGHLLADVMEGKPNEFSHAFRWREAKQGAHTDKIRHLSAKL